MTSHTNTDERAEQTDGQDLTLWKQIRGDYVRHGRSLTDAAFVSLAIHRYARWAYYQKNPIVRWVANKFYGFLKVFILNVTKVWIPAEVVLGKDFHIIHGEGMLSIHRDAVIGDRCGIMHNVTIGTNMSEGVPVIGDDVFIGVNSTVLGDIRIGDRVRIGANTAVTTDVPSDSTVYGSPARIFPRLTPFVSPLPKSNPGNGT
jgi:serine O-acetyltransferase